MIPEAFIRSNLRGLVLIGPEIILTLAIVVLLISGVVFRYRRHRATFTLVAIAALGASLVPMRFLPWPAQHTIYLSKLLAWDGITAFFNVFFVVAAAFTILLSRKSNEIAGSDFLEHTMLVLTVTAAMMLLAAASDLLMIYLAFETMGILSYLLVGIKARDIRSGEAALKYTLYGAVTSGTMLFGFSLLFGVSGTTDLQEISRQLIAAAGQPQNRLLLNITVLFFFTGLLFKTASFPFHFWCPDVYEGAPTPITAFLSVGPKAAGFALFIRLFFPLFAASQQPGIYQAVAGLNWPAALALVSAATMTLGNLAAIQQANLKRLLAYSSIAHAGYMLMGIAALTKLGLQAVIFYLVVYLFMNLGAFAVVASIAGGGGSEDIHSYRGLGVKAPFVCTAMAVFLFSLIGIPPFAGFAGKVYLFAAVISERIYWLAVVAAINTVVSLYYYLRVVKAMFLESAADASDPQVSAFAQILIGILLVPTLGIGIYWQPLAHWVGLIF